MLFPAYEEFVNTDFWSLAYLSAELTLNHPNNYRDDLPIFICFTSQRECSDELLLNILPSKVAEELKSKGSTDANQFDEVAVMFTDFKGFTQISEKLTPSELVAEIHTCLKTFDHIITKHNIEKIKTIGDSYMRAGGLPVTNKKMQLM